QLIQGKNGSFFLTWFRIAYDQALQQFAFHVWFASSSDGLHYTNAKRLSESTVSFNWLPSIIEDNAGRLWVAYTSGRLSQNKEIYLIYSDDAGATWQGGAGNQPIRLTNDSLADDIPSLFQRKDGTYMISWTRYIEAQGYLSSSTENFY